MYEGFVIVIWLAYGSFPYSLFEFGFLDILHMKVTTHILLIKFRHDGKQIVSDHIIADLRPIGIVFWYLEVSRDMLKHARVTVKEHKISEEKRHKGTNGDKRDGRLSGDG